MPRLWHQKKSPISFVIYTILISSASPVVNQECSTRNYIGLSNPLTCPIEMFEIARSKRKIKK